MQPAIGRIRARGSARSGAAAWKAMRYTSVALLFLTVWFVFTAIAMAGATYPEWAAWFRSPLNAGLMVLLVVTAFYHAKLGVQEVIEDYVHTESTKVAAVVALNFVAALLATTCIVAILMLATGV